MDSQEYLKEILSLHPEYTGAPFFLGTPFSKEDKLMIAGVLAMVPAFSSFLGSHCEVIVNSLEDPLHSVIYAEHSSFSRRKAGDPIYIYGLERIIKVIHEGQGLTYFAKSISGHKLKAGVYPILNTQGRCLGCLSLGYNLELPLIDFFEEFYSPQNVLDMNDNFGPKVDVEESVARVLDIVRQDSAIKRRSHIREIIRLLHEKKVFEVRNAVDTVAGLLGSSPATIYWHLRKLKSAKKIPPES